MASSGQKLHIIVTCTERKTAQVPDQLRLRNVPDGAASDQGKTLDRATRLRGGHPGLACSI